MENREQAKKGNYLKVVYIGVCFMVLFSTIIGAQNLMTQIYKQLGYTSLGQVTWFSMFIGTITASIVSTHFQTKVSLKTNLVLGSLTYLGFIMGGVLATSCNKLKSDSGLCSTPFIYAFNMFGGVLRGIGAAFLWSAQALYVNALSDEKTRGTFNGLFLSLMQTSQILSSTIAAFVLGTTDQFTFYMVLLIIAVFAIFMFLFIPNLPQQATQVTQTQTQVPEVSLKESLQRLFGIMREEKYYFLFAVMGFSGTIITFYTTSLGISVVSTMESAHVNIVNQRTSFVFLFLAIGTVLGGLTTGKLADKYDKIKLQGMTLRILEVALLLTFVACHIKSYTLMVLCGFLWGFGDSAINNMLNVVIGSRFNAMRELFACYRFFQPLGSMMTVLLSLFTVSANSSVDGPILLMIVLILPAIGFHTLFNKYKPLEDKKMSDGLLYEDNKMSFEMKQIRKSILKL